jgi:cysteine synthase A
MHEVVPAAIPASQAGHSGWHGAIAKLAQESARSADTHLLKLNFPGFADIDFYFKDEASHPTAA